MKDNPQLNNNQVYKFWNGMSPLAQKLILVISAGLTFSLMAKSIFNAGFSLVWVAVVFALAYVAIRVVYMIYVNNKATKPEEKAGWRDFPEFGTHILILALAGAITVGMNFGTVFSLIFLILGIAFLFGIFFTIALGVYYLWTSRTEVAKKAQEAVREAKTSVGGKDED